MKNCVNYIILALLLGYTSFAMAQEKQLQQLTAHGQVKDAVTGQPVQGVRVEAGEYTALTDEAGAYRVRIPFDRVQLSFSIEGYVKRTVPLQGDSVRNVTIYSEAFRSVKGGDAFNNTVSLSVDDELSLRWGGDVRAVGRSAIAASGDNLFIRGYNSLNATAQPLFVVDGTIWDEQNITPSIFKGFYQSPLADIDVNDIESVDVIKEATSLYGSKGANGVILINTKRGRSNVTRIGADIWYGLNSAPQKDNVMNAAQYRTYLSEIIKGASNAPELATAFSSYFGMDRQASDYSTYHNSNDWADDVFQCGNTKHYGINVQGGDDIAKYSISLGYTGNEGTVKSTGFSRLNTRINSDVYLHPDLMLKSSIYFSYLSRTLQDDGVNAYTSPAFLADIKAPFLIARRYTDDGSILTNTLNDVDALGVTNPVSLIENAKNSDKHYRFGVSVAPTWTINTNWKLNGQFSYTLSNAKEHYFSPMTGVAVQYVDGQAWHNTVKDQTMSQNNLFGNLQLSYGKTLGNGHRVDAFAGYRILGTSFLSTYEDGHNTGNDKVINMNGTLAYRSVDGANTEWHSMAFYSRFGYSYQDRYKVWAVLSEDASSRFGNKASGSFRFMNGSWATFPSIGTSWMLSNETFMKSIDWLNRLNVRTSYGFTGNDDIDGMNRYAYLTSVNYLGAATGLKLSGLANPALKWEMTGKYNAGIDLAFLNERLTISVDYYKHMTSDLLTVKQAPVQTGLDTYLCNGGKLSNEGMEVTFGANLIDCKTFKWYTDFSFSHYVNKIRELPDGDYTTSILGGEVLTAVGSPVGLFYGYKTKGLFTTSEDASAANLEIQNADASYSHFAAGDVYFVDKDKNGIINKLDRQVIGDPNPDLTGSFTNRFTYRNLTLDVLSTYSLGNDVYNYKRQQLESMSMLYNQSSAILNRWKAEGQQTEVPRAVYGDPMGNSRFSDRWIEDGSFFKLKQVKLSYAISINSPYIQGITLWTAGTNLLTCTRYLGTDPEVSMSQDVLYQGIDNGMLAGGRSFYMGVKLNL
ncbi:MAG: SusC/RagA family TonB-linked outer membrane protein [Bacteroidota bacterium]|nr:SusC/RagA family TonB-linked outer membrane protein [Bacteroidota bacterium]